MTGLRIAATLALAIALVVTGCGRRESDLEAEPAGPDSAGGAPTDTAEVVGTGTVLVVGIGEDLYDVFDATGENKLGFTHTGKELTVPAGKCTVVLNNTRQTVTVEPDQQTVVEAGAIAVSGTGQDLYAVWDAAREHKLSFKYTNGEIEVLEGSYVVVLNGSSAALSVAAGEKTVVEAGILVVPGEGTTLYEVYDEAGENKLDFRFVGGEMELLPGTYRVVCEGATVSAVVKAKEKTEVKPE